ncbi:hypothetical protein V8E51_005633 [Hyaloscypha variabilis]
MGNIPNTSIAFAKASQIASDLLLIQATCSTIVTRILLQDALKAFYLGNTSDSNWVSALRDVNGALASGGFSSLVQTVVYSRNSTGSSPNGLLMATANTTGIQLPDQYPNGTYAMLGDPGTLGYPTELYPNITYGITNTPDATNATAFLDFPLNATSALVLGPLQINDSYALVSLTLPIVDNTRLGYVLGFMTVVAAATALIDVSQSREGLGKTGIVIIVGPDRRENLFKYAQRPATSTYLPPLGALNNASVHYILPPVPAPGQPDRHLAYNQALNKSIASNFSMDQYPAAVAGFGDQNSAINNASSILTTTNENNISVAVGYARPQSSLVNWLLIVEQSHSEAWAPINHLRAIVLSCVFGTIGFIILIILPIAHYSVRPIRRLRDATEKSIAPPGYTPNGSVRSERLDEADLSGDEVGDVEVRRSPTSTSQRSKKGLFMKIRRFAYPGKPKTEIERTEDQRRRVFKIPAKVRDRKHFITDELTELTKTFNDMSDELMLQYERLEQKVAERTQELEISKKAAEAANESKTLFIANISHELKTPLNGILGMCAVCMGEDDLPRIKRSLQVVYKSGDLLLHLLNDLLTFSKNQIGQQLSLEEKEFRLVDIKTQILTIFMKQVQEGKINFGVQFLNSDSEPDSEPFTEKVLPAMGPQGAGRLKDMHLWGDQHRILQVIINLVSNSLKFTPEGGKVEVRIKCLGEAETISEGSRNSMGSKQSSQRTSRNRQRNDSGSNSQVSRKPSNSASNPVGTALFLNGADPKSTPRIHIRERSPTPPPANAKIYIFQFEVEDTGPGIPEHLRDRVFEPFVQGDLGLSKKYGGTGLGLSICSQLASLMGGSISLISNDATGTTTGSTFTMKIPLKYTRSRAPSTSSSEIHSRPASLSGNIEGNRSSTPKVPGDTSPKGGFEKDAQPRLVGLSQPFFAAAPSSSSTSKDSKGQLAALDTASARKEPGSKLRVLVAEDNLVNQEVVLRMLKLEDVYDVVVAKDGQEAYDMVKESMSRNQFFDLIFMDIQMPNLDGLQSTRLIRQMGYVNPIVALTAFAEESNVQQCYDSGMDHFLSKPIRRPALKQVLKKFATIPEETETSSLTNKSSTASEQEVIGSSSKNDPRNLPLANGTN